jgi:membrane fusion protein (multidrug efflux system)
MEERHEREGTTDQGGGIFRRQAIDHHLGAQSETSLIELGDRWIHGSYWLLLALSAIAFVFMAVAQVREFAGGTGVIHSEGRVDVTVRLPGTVDMVSVRPGQRVTAGEQLVRLYAADQSAALDRIDSEIENQLVTLLRDPNDPAARTAIAALRAEREVARAQVGERVVRAPQTGIVSFLGVHPGQVVETGDLVASLTRANADFRLIGLLPGQYRPLLHPGMEMRVEIEGFPYAYQVVRIDTVGDQVVGPAALKRYLPQAIADALQAEGPMVLVQARMPGRSFEVGGRPLDLHDGMRIRAEVAVRSESILLSLIPGLRSLTRPDVAPE